MIVVDTNVIAYLLLPGPFTRDVEELLLKDPDWAAPLLWRSEFRNILAGYMKKGSLPPDTAYHLMEQAERRMENNEYSVSSDEVLRLASESGCSAYDCEFVALALDLDLPLVTLDKKVLRAFPKTGITPSLFVKKALS